MTEQTFYKRAYLHLEELERQIRLQRIVDVVLQAREAVAQ